MRHGLQAGTGFGGSTWSHCMSTSEHLISHSGNSLAAAAAGRRSKMRMHWSCRLLEQMHILLCMHARLAQLLGASQLTSSLHPECHGSQSQGRKALQSAVNVS